MIGLLPVCGQTVWRNYVRDVAAPCGFARPWWKARLHGTVPLGSAKHSGETRRVAGERDDWRYRAIGLLLVCGQTVWHTHIRRSTSLPPHTHGSPHLYQTCASTLSLLHIRPLLLSYYIPFILIFYI